MASTSAPTTTRSTGCCTAPGCSLVHEDGRLSLIEREGGLVRASLATARPGKPLFAADLEPGPLRDCGRTSSPTSAPCCRSSQLHARERRMSVLDGEQKTVVRLSLEETAAGRSTGSATALRPRLRLDPACVATTKARRRCPGRAGATTSASSRQTSRWSTRRSGWRAASRAGFPAKVEVPLRSEERADVAAAAVLRALLEVIEANFEGTIDDIDSEFLHDLRVSVRRSRAVQRELKGVFAPARARALPRRVPLAAAGRPATPAISTYTCSSSTRCERS